MDKSSNIPKDGKKLQNTIIRLCLFSIFFIVFLPILFIAATFILGIFRINILANPVLSGLFDKSTSVWTVLPVLGLLLILFIISYKITNFLIEGAFKSKKK